MILNHNIKNRELTDPTQYSMFSPTNHALAEHYIPFSSLMTLGYYHHTSKTFLKFIVNPARLWGERNVVGPTALNSGKGRLWTYLRPSFF